MNASTGDLVEEVQTFETLRSTWVTEQGRFVVIGGHDVVGVYDTYADAVTAGYRARGLEPFLVKQISTVDVVANYSRDVCIPCLTFHSN